MTGKKRTFEGEAKNAAEGAVSRLKGRQNRQNGHPDPGVAADAYFRNLYVKEPDFNELGRRDPAFRSMLREGGINFNEPAAVMQLTKTLLKVDFGLEVELPEDRLCPPVPNRHNYILWLKSLLDSSSYDNPDRQVTGLDIGTGSSCIYPLLGCTQRNWFFVATDVDSKSMNFARANVQRNNLERKVQLLLRQPQDYLLPLEDIKCSIDFVMTNPPFYESEAELTSCAKKKSRPPFTACTGAAVEMVTEGGEVAFIRRILEESLVIRDKVQWYTSMLGKQSSLEEVVDLLRQKGIDNYAVTEFIQGNRTRRWAVGWSFGPMRPSTSAARGLSADRWKKILPPIVDVEIIRAPIDGGSKLGETIQGLMCSLELLSWEWDRANYRGIGRAPENVWGRAWRRRKARELKEGVAPTIGGSNSQPRRPPAEPFGFEISAAFEKSGVVVRCRWREGHDKATFESFCGYLGAQLAPKA